MDAFDARCDRAFELLGAEADAVLIVPPFADICRPALGVHLLQACAEQAGLRVRILYANILFATLSGRAIYNAICYGSYRWMWGDRLGLGDQSLFHSNAYSWRERAECWRRFSRPA